MIVNIDQSSIVIDVTQTAPIVDVSADALVIDVIASNPTIDIVQLGADIDVQFMQPIVDVISQSVTLDVASGGLVPANIDLSAEAGDNLSALRVVRLDGMNKLRYASNDTAANANAVGILTAAVTSGGTGNVRYAGLLSDTSWSWSQGAIYIGADGVLTQTAPSGGLIVREVARAISTTQIIIDIELLIQTV